MFYVLYTILIILFLGYFIYTIINREISPQNKILFIKLKKQYLNGCSNDDIKDLISFLVNSLIERKKRK